MSTTRQTTDDTGPSAVGTKHVGPHATTSYRKKGIRTDLRKCMFCRRDKQKCEITVGEHTSTKRKWPGQKCDRCIKYKYACSANYNAKEEPKCPSCRENKEQCFPPHRAWPGQRCDRCEHYDVPCGVGLTTIEDKQLRQQQKIREDGSVRAKQPSETPAARDTLTSGDCNDQEEDSSNMGPSDLRTSYTTHRPPSAMCTAENRSSNSLYSLTNGVLETLKADHEGIAQAAGPTFCGSRLESEYYAASLTVQRELSKGTDLYSPLGSFTDLPYVQSERSNSQETSLGSPVPAFEANHPAASCELRLDSLGSPTLASQQNNVLEMAGQSRPWTPWAVTECLNSMQWPENVPGFEHETFASYYPEPGVPIFSLNITPSDPYMMNAMEYKLDQRMGSLYGNPRTYDKVCSPKFGNTLAEWYREDVRQLAHCGYIMVKHALFACMAADSLITYRKLERKRKQLGRTLTSEEAYFRKQDLLAFEKYYCSAYHLLEVSMQKYKNPPSSGSLPAKPLLYTCYLLGVAVVCTNQPMSLFQIYMWFMELEKTSGAFPFALTVPPKPKGGWGVVLRLPTDRDGTVHELEVGRDLSALCRQRWRYDNWAQL